MIQGSRTKEATLPASAVDQQQSLDDQGILLSLARPSDRIKSIPFAAVHESEIGLRDILRRLECPARTIQTCRINFRLLVP